MSWLLATAVTELRQLIHDGPTDKLRNLKKVFGDLNGSNKNFKTLEYRRVTDFTSATFPLGVFKNGVAFTVSADYPTTGDFQTTAAPVDGDILTATYYIQYFTDTELNTFMTNATKWLDLGSITTIPDSLQQAALRYGAYQAYEKLALKFSEHISETYRLEDQPNADRAGLIAEFTKLSRQFYDDSVKHRDEYYSRSGKQLQPSWRFSQGRITDPQPKK